VEDEEETEDAARGVKQEADDAVGHRIEAEELALGVEKEEREGAVEAAIVEGAPVVFGPELERAGDVDGAEAGFNEDEIVADSLLGKGGSEGDCDSEEDKHEGQPADLSHHGRVIPVLMTNRLKVEMRMGESL
jgi:hypothetical protein